MQVGGIQCLTGCPIQGLNSSLAVGLLCGLSIGQLTICQQVSFRESKQERMSKMEVIAFYNLISEVISHHLLHCLLKASYLIQLKLKGRGLVKAMII